MSLRSNRGTIALTTHASCFTKEPPMQRSIAVGLGIMEFPFDGADGFWRWVDLCEAGGIDSIW